MSGKETISQPFNNVQLELLKLFADNISETDMFAIKDLISKYFLLKAKDEADQIWEERNLDADELLAKHRRKPYRKIHS